MRLGAGGGAHLTYCSNIHPGESWPEVRANLGRYVTAVKARIAPDRPFGVGLRLSARAAEALSEPEALDEFADFLAAHDLYVFTINGFPYGPFHGTRVKEAVYQPDWLTEERLAYTDLLAGLLARLLPEEAGLEGSVSTVPGTFKPLARDRAAVARMAAAMIRHAATLVRLRAETGRTIALALEPEPHCFIETVDEAVRFFEQHLFARDAVEQMAALTGLGAAAAEAALHRHLGVCYDLCHGAVAYEAPGAAVARLAAAGIGIAKLQLSAGLRVAEVGPEALARLRAFDDAVYLHQVVERGPSGLVRYLDLPEALAAAERATGPREWRVHFHVPVFLDDLGAFSTTQPVLAEALALQRAGTVSPHLEVETYTWDVLPESLRTDDVVTAIARELDWVGRRLGA